MGLAASFHFLLSASCLGALCATIRHVDECTSATDDEYSKFPDYLPIFGENFIREADILVRILALSRPHALYLFSFGPLGAFYSSGLPLYIQRAINIFPQICDSLFFASLHRTKIQLATTEPAWNRAELISFGMCALCVRFFPLERLQVSPVSAFDSRIYLYSHFSGFFLFDGSTFFPSFSTFSFALSVC